MTVEFNHKIPSNLVIRFKAKKIVVKNYKNKRNKKRNSKYH